MNPNQKPNYDLPFYKILEKLEKKARLTENEAIKRMGIPRSTYRSWKDGTCEPSRRVQWRRLIEVFQTDASTLIFGPQIFSDKTIQIESRGGHYVHN